MIFVEGENGTRMVLASSLQDARKELEPLPDGWKWVDDGEDDQSWGDQKGFWFHQEETE